jgi:phospholipid/cholesterol/gamma-HCH transport system substrate-binding protein
MKQRFKFRHVNEITGAFVILVAVVLVAAIVWTGYRQRWFRGTVTLRIVLPEAGAAGIGQGSEVYFLGTLVGTVSDVIVDEAGRMEARTSIHSDFFRFLREDSSAVVKKKFGVAGDAYFEITRGQGQPLLRKDASIVCKELPGTMETMIEEVRNAVLPALEKLSVGVDTWTAVGTKLSTGVDTWTTLGEKLSAGADAWTRLGTNLGESRQHLDQLIARLDRIVVGVELGKGTVGKLLTDPALADELKTILEKGNASMDQLQGILKDVQLAGTNLSAVSEALAVEAKDLPGLILQTQQMLHELERLIEGIERHWLIRKYIEKRQPNTRIPPSEVVP